MVPTYPACLLSCSPIPLTHYSTKESIMAYQFALEDAPRKPQEGAIPEDDDYRYCESQYRR